MGYHFAHLLAHSQTLRAPGSVTASSTITEMIDRSRTIMNLAIDTTDDRTRHLTDQIYHIITFSALTLCRLLHNYEPQLRAIRYDTDALDNLIVRLIDWLKSIGLPCHAAHLLGDIISADFKTLRQNYQSTAGNLTYGSAQEDAEDSYPGDEPLPPDAMLLYPEFIGWELLEVNADTTTWPEWAPS